MLILKAQNYKIFAFILICLCLASATISTVEAKNSVDYEFSEEALNKAAEEQDFTSYPVPMLRALLEKYEFLKKDFLIYELIADHYLMGFDFAEYDPSIALKYYQKAAEVPMQLDDYFGADHEVTHTRIMVKLAGMYRNGLGTAPDEEQAIYWLNKARNIYGPNEPGSSMANIQLGSIYSQNKAVEYAEISFEFLKELFNDAKIRGKEYPKFLDRLVEQVEGTYSYDKLPCSDLLRDRPKLLHQPFQRYNPIPEFIKFGISLERINEIDTQGKKVDISYYSSEIFNDYRLNFDTDNFGTRACVFQQKLLKDSLSGNVPLFLWDPDIVADNSNGESLDRNSNVYIYHDGTVEKFLQKRASFDVEMDLRSFPFDTQKFTLSFSPARHTAHSVRLDSTESNPFLDRVKPKVGDEEWILISNKGEVKDRYENGYLKSFYEYEITLKRNPVFYIVNLFMPLLTIFLISVTHFWFANEKLDAKVTVVLSSLVAVIAYQFIAKDDLPKLSYLTNLDITITVTMVLIAINAITIALNQYLITTGQAEKANKLNAISRLAQPLLWLFLVASINMKDFLNWISI